MLRLERVSYIQYIQYIHTNRGRQVLWHYTHYRLIYTIR